MDFLETDIKFLPGVGPKKKEILKKELGIETFGQLLEHYPYKYVDRSRIYAIREIDGEMPFVQVKGRIASWDIYDTGKRQKRYVAHFTDGTGFVDLVWFQGGQYAYKNYSVLKEYIVFGKPSPYNGRYQFTHPDIDDATDLVLSDMGLQPHYHTTERMKTIGLTSRSMEKLTKTLLSKLATPLPETLPPFLLKPATSNLQPSTLNLISRDEAMRLIHYPHNHHEMAAAQMRLKFEELFYVQLNILRYVGDRRKRYGGCVFSKVGQNFNYFFYNNLKFQLTEAQKRVIREIRTDMGSGRQMNRLLQGDVGSGKTLVALMTMLIALDNGYQAVIMAPTEILAEQHLQTISDFLHDMPIRVELLTGIVKGKKRTEVLSGIKDGTVNIVVGTHAVIEDTVIFHNLGLAVIDEQHRFGVAQRAKLWRKSPTAKASRMGGCDALPKAEICPGPQSDFLKQQKVSSASGGTNIPPSGGLGGLPPHILVMTATPIPRTLAMTLYGDLDVSVIDELPPGRKPVRTIHRYDNQMTTLYQGIRQQIGLGRQVYIVYPLIKESEKMDLLDLEQGFEMLQRVFPEYRMSKVHGQMKPAEKEVEMQRFVNGETQILVATTVIEVGVNVPNASVMVIMESQRFGLSQLHQLRGRVGRGADQSYCILVSSRKLTKETKMRLDIMCETNDGFRIAEADLKLRGPGDLEGTQQSGMAFDLRIANIAQDGQLVQLARETAQQVIGQDPECSRPEFEILWRHLRELRKTNVNWGAIS